MADRTNFAAGEKKPDSSVKKYMDSLRAGDTIRIYQDDDHYTGKDDTEAGEIIVLFTTPDVVAARCTWTPNREIVVFYKSNGEEVDPDENNSPARIVFK